MTENDIEGEMIPDLARIEAALKDARRVAATMKRGGLQELHDDLTWSLEALERVLAVWKERGAQMALFDVERKGEKGKSDGQGYS